MMYKYEPQALQQPFDPSAGIGEFMARQFLPYNQPEPTQQPFDPSAGIGEFERRRFLPYNQQQPSDPLGGFKAKQLAMQQQQPFDPSAGIGEFESRQFQPRQSFDSSAGIGDFEARQFPPQQFQAPQQQSYQPMPQAPGMQPLLQQFRTQQRPYQSPYQNLDGGGRSGSAYSYNNSLFGQMNNLAPLNKNALNFSY